LFLHVLTTEGKITSFLAKTIEADVRQKISKYIENSKDRAEK
jgi:hypothetical protein